MRPPRQIIPALVALPLKRRDADIGPIAKLARADRAQAIFAMGRIADLVNPAKSPNAVGSGANDHKLALFDRPVAME